MDNIFDLLFSVAALFVFLYFSLRKYKLMKRMIKAKENEALRQIGKPILVQGRVISKDEIQSEFSKTPAVVNYWALSLFGEGGWQKDWNEKISGWNGSAVELKTSSGVLFTIPFKQEVMDFNDVSEVTKLSYASVRITDHKTKVAEMFSSKTKPSAEQIQSVLDFAAEKGIKTKALFNTHLKTRVDEWMIKSGDTFTVLGNLSEKHQISGTAKEKVIYFKKSYEDIVRSTKKVMYSLLVASVIWLVIIGALVVYGDIKL